MTWIDFPLFLTKKLTIYEEFFIQFPNIFIVQIIFIRKCLIAMNNLKIVKTFLKL